MCIYIYIYKLIKMTHLPLHVNLHVHLHSHLNVQFTCTSTCLSTCTWQLHVYLTSACTLHLHSHIHRHVQWNFKTTIPPCPFKRATLYFEDHILAFGAEREVDNDVKPQRLQRANSLRLLGLLWTQCSKLVQEIALKHTCTLVRLQGYSKANYNGKT